MPENSDRHGEPNYYAPPRVRAVDHARLRQEEMIRGAMQRKNYWPDQIEAELDRFSQTGYSPFLRERSIGSYQAPPCPRSRLGTILAAVALLIATQMAECDKTILQDYSSESAVQPLPKYK